jgi:hypothetical protein
MDREKKRIGLVVTTISDGSFIDAYARALSEYEFADNISFYIIGDVNTPPQCEARANRARAEGFRCYYYNVDRQKKFLRPFPELEREIPLRSDNRRNVGYLLAFQERNDVIISIDDDNFPLPGSPFFEEHASVGSVQKLPLAAGRNSWFNLCSLLRTSDYKQNRIDVYPRGFPYKRRVLDESHLLTTEESGTIGVNAGLWLGDPDIDAATRLVTRCEAESEKAVACFLGPACRTPINSQNTALTWHAVPAYYFVLMGHSVNGLMLDRFGDIFSGYFLQLCVQAVGQRIRLGAPLVRQLRNEHNLFKDLWHELAGMVFIEDMVSLLEEPLSAADSYDEAYLELAERLVEWSRKQNGFLWNEEAVAYFEKISSLMKCWTSACRQLASGASLECRPALDTAN